MSVKQPAHRRCSKAVSSFILLPGTKIKEGKSLELQEYWGIPASFEMSLVSPGRFSPSAFRPEPPSPQPTSRCHLACSRRTPIPKTFSQLLRGSFEIGACKWPLPPAPPRLPPRQTPRGTPAREPRPGAAAGPGRLWAARRAQPSGGPSDCGAADRIADTGPQPFPRRLPPARGPGAAGPRRGGSAPPAPCAPGGFPAATRPPARSRGPARARRLRPPRPRRVPRGVGFPSARAPSPPAPCICVTARHARPHARPPTSPPLLRGLSQS